MMLTGHLDHGPRNGTGSQPNRNGISTELQKCGAAWESSPHDQLGRLAAHRMAAPDIRCDQEIWHFDSTALPLWGEIWVESRRCPESVNSGAAQCRSLHPDAADALVPTRGRAAMPAAALQGAAQVYSEEAPAQDALAKRARPASAGAVAGTGERAPGRPHGSGPFGINLLSTERAEALRATHLSGRARQRCDCISAATAA